MNCHVQLHGDISTRNACLRKGGQRLCAFDWELACAGLPAQDLVDLLVFVADGWSREKWKSMIATFYEALGANYDDDEERRFFLCVVRFFFYRGYVLMLCFYRICPTLVICYSILYGVVGSAESFKFYSRLQSNIFYLLRWADERFPSLFRP